MGAWGHHTFENDAAADWALELEQTEDLSVVVAALEDVEATANGYLDLDVACRGLAACETLVLLRENLHAPSQTAGPVNAWVAGHRQHVSPELLNRARSAIERILSEDSELREVWDEVGSAAWEASVRSILQRITG